MAQDFYSSQNTIQLDTENYDSVTAGYIPQDDEKICRFFRTSGKCYKGSLSCDTVILHRFALIVALGLGIRCQYYHERPETKAFTGDKKLIYYDLPQLPLPLIGSNVAVRVTCVSKSFRFYCVLPHGSKDTQDFWPEDDGGEDLKTLQVSPLPWFFICFDLTRRI